MEQFLDTERGTSQRRQASSLATSSPANHANTDDTAGTTWQCPADPVPPVSPSPLVSPVAIGEARASRTYELRDQSVGSETKPARKGSSDERTSKTASFTLKIFYPDALAADEIDDYNQAFSFWYEIWLETRREVDSTLATPSDSFSRQSEILVLYYQGKPIATCCHRYVDLRHQCTIHDSYFSSAIWPASVKEKIPSLGQSCLLGSHIFIHPDFRKSQSGLPIKNIVCALSMAHTNGTRPDVLLGACRVDKGIHKVFHDAGAISLRSDANWYHIPVDLIALFPKKSPIPIDAHYQDIVRSVGKTCPRFARSYFERKSSSTI